MIVVALGRGDSDHSAHAQDVIRHLEYAVSVCGEDNVGIGTERLYLWDRAQ